MISVGDILEAPWGRYAVHRASDVVVLRSLEREGAFIIAPDERYVPTGEKVTAAAAAQGWSDVAPVPADHANGKSTGGVGRPGRNESSPQHDQVSGTSRPRASSGGNLLVDSVDASNGAGEVAVAKPAPTRLTLGGMRPGLPYCVVGGELCIMWRPCFTRARDEHGSKIAETHCWFLSSNRDQSLFCHQCRIGKPMTLMGPRRVIAPIIKAIADGDRARVDELVAAFFASPTAPVESVWAVEHPAPAIPPAGGLSSALPPSSSSCSVGADVPSPEFSGAGSLGDGGRPPDVELAAVPPAPAPSVAAKEATGPAVASPLPSGSVRPDDPKDAVADFGWKQVFVPRDHADWLEFFNERAAIFEYLGGVSRPLAEAKARDLAGREPRAA